MMTTVPNKHYRGHCRITQEEGDLRTSGKDIWRKKWGQKV